MRKIKLFIIHDRYIDDDYYGGSYTYNLGAGISEWEEVSDEDFDYIKTHINMISSHMRCQVVMVEQMNDGVPTAIESIKKTLDKLRRDEEKRREAEKLRKEEAASKRLAKKLERDRKALAKLLEQNPDLIKDLTK